ncbi:MAG TPA: hypothetical protein VG407_17165 [Caulobacteraceae bacterium]|jgi:hypothetical protein|nr:hypothetical protein [Caulobacteraceae bacterium]
MKRAAVFAFAAFALLSLAACTAGSATAEHAAHQGFIVQFVMGFWHGMIAPFTLLGEIIDKFFPKVLPWHVHLYESRGTGVAYDIGFYLGLVGSPVAIIHRNHYYATRRA